MSEHDKRHEFRGEHGLAPSGYGSGEAQWVKQTNRPRLNGSQPRCRTISHIGVVGFLILWGFACSNEVTEAEATLEYDVTRWVISGTINADALAAGGTLELVLREGGFVNGSLYEPAAVTGNIGVTSDMAGTWIKRGDTVRFSQVTQTFVSDIAWILTPEMLTAADSHDGNFYEVELTRRFK